MRDDTRTGNRALRATLILCVAALGLALAPAPAGATPKPDQGIERFFEFQGVPDDLEEPWREFVEGWSAFGNWHFLVQEMVSLALAALLGAVIAFHPRSRRERIDLQDLEQPKAIIIYAVVGAAVSEIVLFNPPMAFVVFGIGGLMRFRTLIGAPKDTGRTIFAAVMGLACGLKLFPLAVLGTAFVWGLIWVLEAHVPAVLEVRKVPEGQLAAAAEAWRRALTGAGCRIRRERVVPGKDRIEIAVLVPRGVDVENLREQAGIPPETGGQVSWKHD